MVLTIGDNYSESGMLPFAVAIHLSHEDSKKIRIKHFVSNSNDGRPDYFDELLARIRDVRASEKRFYQKVRDLFTLSSDYDGSDKATQMFYAETQNKILFAIRGKRLPKL